VLADPQGFCVEFEAYGFQGVIRAFCPRARQQIIESWLLPGWRWKIQLSQNPGLVGPAYFELRGPRADGLSYELYHDSRLVAVANHPEQISGGLESWFHNLLAEHSPKIFLHAGVVEWQGKLLVFPAKSFSGKSTLINAMCRAGARYYSDEFAVMDPSDGRIQSFPRRLSLRPGDRIEPHSLGWSSELKARLPDFMFDLVFQPDCPSLELQSVSRGQAALALFENCVSAGRFGSASLAVFQKALGNCQCFRGGRGEANLVAQEILKITQQTA